MSLTISFDSHSGDVNADSKGNYNLTVFGFITGYTGIAQLVVYGDNNTERVYSGFTNELGAVGFCISGILPEGERKKSYPMLLLTPHEQQKSFFTVKVD